MVIWISWQRNGEQFSITSLYVAVIEAEKSEPKRTSMIFLGKKVTFFANIRPARPHNSFEVEQCRVQNFALESMIWMTILLTHKPQRKFSWVNTYSTVDAKT